MENPPSPVSLRGKPRDAFPLRRRPSLLRNSFELLARRNFTQHQCRPHSEGHPGSNDEPREHWFPEPGQYGPENAPDDEPNHLYGPQETHTRPAATTPQPFP